MNIYLEKENYAVEGDKIIIKIDDNMKRILGMSNLKLSDLEPGQVFQSINGIKYIVCEQFFDGTAVVRKETLDKKMRFGSTNNWKESDWRTYLNADYLRELEEFGAENIVQHEVSLLSLDGYDDYGVSVDKVSVMNIDRYRKYHKLIGNVDKWNWLLTPNSTPSGIGTSYVQCVNSNGYVNYSLCDCDGAVRPFFILKSDIFVSPVR